MKYPVYMARSTRHTPGPANLSVLPAMQQPAETVRHCCSHRPQSVCGAFADISVKLACFCRIFLGYYWLTYVGD